MRHQSLGKKDTVYVPRIATSPSLNSTPQNTLSCLCFCQQFSVRDSVFFVTVFQAEQALVFALFLTVFFRVISLSFGGAIRCFIFKQRWVKCGEKWPGRRYIGLFGRTMASFLWFVLLQMHFLQNEISDIKRLRSWISACREFFQLLLPCIYKHVNDIFFVFFVELNY